MCINYICQILINCLCVQPLVTVQYIWQYQKFKIILFILPSMPKLSILNLWWTDQTHMLTLNNVQNAAI